MRSIFVACLFAVAAAGCGNGNDCLPALPSMAPCPTGTFIDASTTDPICLASSGVPLCRGAAEADCYVCSGAAFDDNCVITSPQQTVECVHHCDLC